MAYFIEDHLPEYEYTLMVNAYAEEVPAINFSCACDELELITATDVQSTQKACNVDQLSPSMCPASTRSAEERPTVRQCRWTRTCLLIWKTLQKPSARKCLQGFASMLRICLGLQWCKTAKADLRCFAQEFLFAPFRMAFKQTRTTSNFIR